jgi:hypothetical protein
MLAVGKSELTYRINGAFHCDPILVDGRYSFLNTDATRNFGGGGGQRCWEHYGISFLLEHLRRYLCGFSFGL